MKENLTPEQKEIVVISAMITNLEKDIQSLFYEVVERTKHD